jgi:hypothetical protein
VSIGPRHECACTSITRNLTIDQRAGLMQQNPGVYALRTIGVLIIVAFISKSLKTG